MKYLFIILLLTSCSANWHLRQANKHLIKAQQKGAIIKHDTIFKEVVIPHTITDTVTLLQKKFLTDTITLETVRWKSKTKIDTVHKTIYQQVECKPDTVKVPVTITNTIDAKSWPWWWLIVAVFVGMGITVLLLILRKLI